MIQMIVKYVVVVMQTWMIVMYVMVVMRAWMIVVYVLVMEQHVLAELSLGTFDSDGSVEILYNFGDEVAGFQF